MRQKVSGSSKGVIQGGSKDAWFHVSLSMFYPSVTCICLSRNMLLSISGGWGTGDKQGGGCDNDMAT